MLQSLFDTPSNSFHPHLHCLLIKNMPGKNPQATRLISHLICKTEPEDSPTAYPSPVNFDSSCTYTYKSKQQILDFQVDSEIAACRWNDRPCVIFDFTTALASKRWMLLRKIGSMSDFILLVLQTPQPCVTNQYQVAYLYCLFDF